jgi:hypothetical protein
MKCKLDSFAQGDLVTISQLDAACNSDSIDKGAIGAAEILDGIPLFGLLQARMSARDLWIADDDRVLQLTSDGDFTLGELKDLFGMGTFEHDQVGLSLIGLH